MTEYKGSTPNCPDCIPELYPENRHIIEVFQMVNTQYIMSFGGIVDIDINAVCSVLKLYGYHDRRTFDKVIMICRKRIKTITEESKNGN